MFLVGVVGLALVAVPVAAAQLEATMQRLPPFIDQARQWASELRPQVIGQSITALLDAGARIVSPPVSTAPTTGQVVQVGLTVAEAVFSTLTLLTLVYFWLVEHARLQRYVLAFVPAESRAGSREIWNHVEERLGLWVRGQLILMAAMGTATTIAYTILGVPGALILGLIAAITEAIPLVGPLLGAIPAVLVAATVSPQLALVVAGVYVVLQFLEGQRAGADGHAQHGRDLAVPRDPQPAGRRGRRRPGGRDAGRPGRRGDRDPHRGAPGAGGAGRAGPDA